MFILVDISDRSTENAFALIARTFVNLDRWHRIIDEQTGELVPAAPLFMCEGDSAAYHLMPNTIYVTLAGNARNKLNNYNDADLFKYVDYEIYEAYHDLSEQWPDALTADVIRCESSHIIKRDAVTISFDRPTSNINIVSWGAFTLKNICKDSSTGYTHMIIHTGQYKQIQPVVYATEWPQDVLPYKIVACKPTCMDIIKKNSAWHIIAGEKGRPNHPWRMYESDATVDVGWFDKVCPFVFDKGVIVVDNNKTQLMSITNNLDDISNATFIYVNVARTFAETASSYFDWLKPSDKKIMAEVLCDIDRLWRAGVEIQRNVDHIKIGHILLTDKDNIDPNDGDIVVFCGTEIY